MKFSLITDPEQLGTCRDRWNAVAQSRAFFRWEWLATWSQQFLGPSDQLHILVAYDTTDAKDRTADVTREADEETWVGIAPFFVSGRKLRLLGSGTACSDYAGLICDSQHARQFTELVSDYLAQEVRSGGALAKVETVELEGCLASDDDVNYLGELLSAHRFVLHEDETEGTWTVLLPDELSQLTATFSKGMRRKVRAANQRLANPLTSICLAESDNFETCWEKFVTLHQRRRGSLQQAGCFADPRFETFLKTASRSMIEAGLATLMVIEVDQRPISTVLLLRSEDRMMVYQSGSEPDASAMEPGYQAIVIAMNHAIDAGCKTFDFLRGDEPYKARWNTTRHALVRRRHIPRNISAQLKHSTWVLGRSIRNYAACIGQGANK